MISDAAKERRRERDRLKKRRKAARLKAERLKALNQAVSKTSAAYRQIRFGVVPERTKSELRAELARAIMNTR